MSFYLSSFPEPRIAATFCLNTSHGAGKAFHSCVSPSVSTFEMLPPLPSPSSLSSLCPNTFSYKHIYIKVITSLENVILFSKPPSKLHVTWCLAILTRIYSFEYVMLTVGVDTEWAFNP